MSFGISNKAITLKNRRLEDFQKYSWFGSTCDNENQCNKTKLMRDPNSYGQGVNTEACLTSFVNEVNKKNIIVNQTIGNGCQWNLNQEKTIFEISEVINCLGVEFSELATLRFKLEGSQIQSITLMNNENKEKSFVKKLDFLTVKSDQYPSFFTDQVTDCENGITNVSIWFSDHDPNINEYGYSPYHVPVCFSNKIINTKIIPYSLGIGFTTEEPTPDIWGSIELSDKLVIEGKGNLYLESLATKKLGDVSDFVFNSTCLPQNDSPQGNNSFQSDSSIEHIDVVPSKISGLQTAIIVGSVLISVPILGYLGKKLFRNFQNRSNSNDDQTTFKKDEFNPTSKLFDDL